MLLNQNIICMFDLHLTRYLFKVCRLSRFRKTPKLKWKRGKPGLARREEGGRKSELNTSMMHKGMIREAFQLKEGVGREGH
jgi:hypothetical protein